MKIRQAPVADLLNYLQEIYMERPKDIRTSNILNIVNKYYCSLTNHKTILPVGNDFMTDWCDLNHSNTMENCPNVPGIIVYRNKPDGTKMYGVLYHSGYITTENKQTNYLSYYYAHPEGHINSHSYLASDWDGWGAPVRYFSFSPDVYVENRFWALGERPLSLHNMGHDVRQLQAFLSRANKQVMVSGYFDKATLEALHEVQSWCNLPISDTFELNTDGQKIISFLTGDK